MDQQWTFSLHARSKALLPHWLIQVTGQSTQAEEKDAGEPELKRATQHESSIHAVAPKLGASSRNAFLRKSSLQLDPDDAAGVLRSSIGRTPGVTVGLRQALSTLKTYFWCDDGHLFPRRTRISHDKHVSQTFCLGALSIWESVLQG